MLTFDVVLMIGGAAFVALLVFAYRHGFLAGKLEVLGAAASKDVTAAETAGKGVLASIEAKLGKSTGGAATGSPTASAPAAPPTSTSST